VPHRSAQIKPIGVAVFARTPQSKLNRKQKTIFNVIIRESG